MARTEAQKRASAKYNKDHTKLFTMRLQLNGDEDIMAYLDALPNKQGRVKELIRADIARANSGKKEEEKTMKTYHIKPDYLSQWGEECTEDTVITQDELERLAAEWKKPVDELMEQLEEI